MNKKKIWDLIAVPGLAIMSLLFAFLLLGWNTAEVMHDRPTAIIHIQSLGDNFATSEMRPATNGPVSAGNLQVCGDVWVTETVDSAGDVGTYNSLALALTSPYTPYISYRDYITSENYNLKYAWLSGTTWFSQTVDSGGEWTSLVLAPTYPYSPFIVHNHWWGEDLKYACRNGATWITGIMSYMRAGEGSLALEPTYPYTPHVSYSVPWETDQTLHHAYLSGTTWCSGTWVGENVEPLLSKTGGQSSLALASAYPYTSHISYYDIPNSDLKHAWKSGTTWFSQTVDSEGEVGVFSSLALDSTGNPHIAYQDNTHRTLKYAWLNGTTWLSETVGKVAWVDLSNPVRRPISLDLNQADVPYISYYDSDNGALRLAYLSGTVWITQTIASVGNNFYQFTSLRLDQAGCPHISYYDSTNLDLKYAYLSRITYLPIIMKN